MNALDERTGDRPLTHVERARWAAHDPAVARLLARMRALFPGLRIVFKDELRAYRVLARVVPDEVLYRMSTTLFRTIAVGSRARAERDQRWYFRVLAHELVHLFQFQRPGRLVLTYLAPQVWALLAGAGLVAACCAAAPGEWIAAAGGAWALASVAPWPSPWRLRAEVDAYLMSFAVDHWRGRRIATAAIDDRARTLCSWRYWKMAWRYRPARARLARAVDRVQWDPWYLRRVSPAFDHVHEVLHGHPLPITGR